MEKPAIAGGTPVRDTKLNYGHQYIDEADIKAVTQVLQSECLTCGPKVNELEKRLCALTGAKYAVACSNGTAALHIAAMAAGLKKGDEVLSPLRPLQTVPCTAKPDQCLQIFIQIRIIWIPKVYEKK